jgi:uncharacterized membrane protein YcaP (DUF421 family)
MEFVKIALTSAFSIAALFLLTKMMGNKQISQMSMFDYITGISIGSIAAEMASELESPWRPLEAMAVYALAALAISMATLKFNSVKKYVTGRPLILFDNGVLYRKNIEKARLDISELLTQCRVNGYFDLGQLRMIIVENNGQFSFLPKSGYRPATPSDFSKQPDQESIWTDVIMDGNVLKANLKKAGRDEEWLRRRMEEQGYKKTREIYLACCDGSGALQIYAMDDRKLIDDPFE